MSAQPAVDRPRLRPLRLARDVLRIYRAHWFGLVVAAVIVFAPLALLDAAFDLVHPAGLIPRGLVSVGEGTSHLFGDVFYTGLVAAAVIAWRSGAERQTPRQVAKALPWLTIAILDVLLPLATAIGLLLFILPGIWIYVTWSLAPAIVKIDHVGVVEGLRRSRAAVRGNFWRVLMVVVVLVGAAGVCEELLQELVDAYIGDTLISLAVQTVFAPFFGLATVLMAFELHPRPARPEDGSGTAPEPH